MTKRRSYPGKRLIGQRDFRFHLFRIDHDKMKRHLIHLIATLLLALLVVAHDEQARDHDGHRDPDPPAIRDGEQQQVLDVDVPPEVGQDGELLGLRLSHEAN